MEPKEYISGKIFFRHMGSSKHIKDTRLLFACAGVLGIPESVGLKPEHIYHITSGSNPIGDLYSMIDPDMDIGLPKDIQQLHLHLVTGQDLTDQMRGQGIGGVLTSPIWQI
jgi:hypothetical protein